jgi:hypothetical protein
MAPYCSLPCPVSRAPPLAFAPRALPGPIAFGGRRVASGPSAAPCRSNGNPSRIASVYAGPRSCFQATRYLPTDPRVSVTLGARVVAGQRGTEPGRGDLRCGHSTGA